MVSTFIRWTGWAESPAQDSMLKPACITRAAVCLCMEVDPDDLQTQMAVFKETMQPEKVSLWLREKR